MPHLHLSSLVTKKKIETGVIFFHSTSRLCTYPYLAHLLYIIKCVPHCPVLAAAAPDPTDVAAGKTDAAAGKTDAAAGKTDVAAGKTDAAAGKTDAAAGKTDAAAGKTGSPTEHARDGPTTSTTYGQPPHRHQTKRRGAIYDARRPAGRNHRRMTTRPRRHAQHPRLSVRLTSCRLRAAAGVINGAPTTHRHQDNPAERNRRRTQHPRRPVRLTSCRLRAAAGVINGAPTTHRHQDNPAGRNRRRT